MLADGTPFRFYVNVDEYRFPPNRFSQVNVILELPVLLGDLNLDASVDFFDISPFIDLLAKGGFQAEADFDRNGTVDFLDIPHFIAILSARK